MTEHEKYQEHIRHSHDAFCKTVIRHAAIDAARSIQSRRKREISLEYLIEEKHYPFSTTDKYFAEQSGMTSYPLFVCGQIVLLESPELAAAPAFADVADPDTAKAAQWCVEQGLMKRRLNGKFAPGSNIPAYQVLNAYRKLAGG